MILRRLVVVMLLVPPWALFCVCCYWYFIDNEPPAVHTKVMVMDHTGAPISVVHPGEKLVIARDSCVTDEGKAFYTRWLFSRDRKFGYLMPSGEVQLLKGCVRRFNEIAIPTNIETGLLYDYVVTMTFVNNPLVETRMTLPIPSFEVLP